MKQLSVHVITNIPYLGCARQETLDLYRPVHAPSHPLPGVVIIHGGSWAKGDKASPRIVALAETLVHHGFICASVNFLLATPAVPSWPTCLLDCKSAVQFLRVHAHDYGIDAQHIGVIGGSWGGYLAALVAATGEHLLRPTTPYPGASCALQAAIMMYAPLDPIAVIAPEKLALLFGGTRDELPAAYEAAMPATHLTHQHPPVLLLHGSDDTNVPLNQTYAYAAHLQACKIAHTVVVIPNEGHLPEQAVLMPHILAFLTAYLKPVPKQENSQSGKGYDQAYDNGNL